MRLKKNFIRALAASAFVSAVMAVGSHDAYACSRVVFLGDSANGAPGLVMVGRTLDWRTPIPTSLYVYPRGVERQSMPQGPMLKWTSKYASVMAVSYDSGVTEGMNECGLVMNSLFCKGSIYTPQVEDSPKPVMSMAVLISYFLDNYATVDEVYDVMSKDAPFVINAQPFDGGTVTALHFDLTDVSGQTMVMEYVDGKLNIVKGREYIVLTNDPPMPQMLAIDKYWQGVGGQNFLPGSPRSADRFARAHFFITHLPKDTDSGVSFAALSSVMGSVSVPYGYEIEGEKNISSTQWRSIADLTNKRYHFKFAVCPGDFYVDMGRLGLNPGAPILKLDTTNPVDYFGDINGRLKKSEPFKPMW